MKTMIALMMVIVAACAAPAAGLRGSSQSFAGPWQGVLMKGKTRTPAEFRFAASDAGYQGYFWGQTLTPVELTGLQLGQTVHFEVPQMGVFDGTTDGETMQGTFRDETGEGAFKLAKQADDNDPLNVAF